MSRFIRIMLFLLIILTTADAIAQTRRSRVSKQFRKSSKRASSFSGSKATPYWSFGFSLNTLNYYGDITPRESFASSDIRFTRPGIGVQGAYTFGGRFNVEGSFVYGRLQADDKTIQDIADPNARFRYVRNLHFRNDIKELSIVGTFDFFENYGTYINRFILVPYVSAGITILHHNPQAIVPDAYYLDPNTPFDEARAFENAGTWVSLWELGTEGQHLPADLKDQYASTYGRELNDPYSRIQIAIPIVLGVRYKLTRTLDLSLQVGYRQLFTDYIDDVSGGYVDLTLFDYYEGVDTELAKAMSYRSNEPVNAFNRQQRNVLPDGFTYLPQDNFTGFNNDAYNYLVVRGYGSDFRPASELNLRGSPTDNDIYLVTSIRLSYILGGSFRNARFR